MTVRKGLPYLMLSLAVHAVLLGLLLLWRLPADADPPIRRVLLEFRRPGDSRALPPSGSPASQLHSSPAGSTRRAVPGLRVPEGARLAMPPAAASGPAVRQAAQPLPRLLGQPAQAPEATGAAAMPTQAQVLRAMAGKEREQPAPRQESALRQEPPIEGNARAGYMPSTALEWRAGGRSLLLRPRLRYPELLLEKGLEVDVEAAFIVAPSGQVTSVEITRSSGFASVDREVEQALRDALFAESVQEDSGRIQFRFRLERKQ